MFIICSINAIKWSILNKYRIKPMYMPVDHKYNIINNISQIYCGNALMHGPIHASIILRN